VRIIDLEVLGEEFHGDAGGFLRVRRLRLRNRREDGTHSGEYVCDFVVRPKGPDAVVVVLWRRAVAGIEVLLRAGLRPALWFGRDPHTLPLPDDARTMWMTEVVAGILEHDDRGEQGVRRRAAIEAWEEAGYRVDPDEVRFLGAGTFPTPGSMPEKYWLVAAEIAADAEQSEAEGDGSPMEHGAVTRWCPLDEAIAACVAGQITDAKTELALRRLRDEVCGLARPGDRVLGSSR
jgi:ADP-ribose pyrophosphatase